ncbi:MAG: hypothetical protein ACJ8AO_05250 [Gemmatimonadaceae bacterium]
MRRLLVVAAALVLNACRTPDKDEPRVSKNDSGRGTVSGVDRPADSLTIHNRDGSVDLGLANGAVWMALSDSVRAKVRADMVRDTADTAGGGIGGLIERTVKQNVRGLLEQRITRPLDDIRDVRYQDGRIVFDYSGSSLVKFENIKVNKGEPVLASFREDDARRFVAEVRRAKGLSPLP